MGGQPNGSCYSNKQDEGLSRSQVKDLNVRKVDKLLKKSRDERSLQANSISIKKVIWNLNEEIVKDIEKGVALEVDLQSKKPTGGPSIFQ
ncbi:hypothetical protein QYF36_019119 [Acer negundo]|nr:hypothetical protein QYF36_019119 [Acer negundo]